MGVQLEETSEVDGVRAVPVESFSLRFWVIQHLPSLSLAMVYVLLSRLSLRVAV